MLCTVYRLAVHSSKLRRNLLSVLCRYQHEASEFFESPRTLKGDEHSEQNYMVNSSSRQRQMTRLHQLSKVKMKNIFKVDDTSIQRQEEETEDENGSSRVILNSEAMTEFKSSLADCNDMMYSHEDWKKLKAKALMENPNLKKSWETLCMQLMYGHGQAKLALCFMDYMKAETLSPNISTLSLFLALQGKHGTKGKENIVQETYRDILKITDVFDSITARYLIAGLACTSQWRKALDILDMVKLTGSPGRSYFSPIIAAAVREQNTQVAFELLDELTVKGVEPQDIVLQEVLRACEGAGNHDLLEKYFIYMWKYSWILSPAMAKEIELYFTRLVKEKWTCKWTFVNKVRGVCHHCRQGLERIELSTWDFESLQREFLERTLVGSNVYLQSTPEEMERFKDFVMENAPFDVVLDALNIAFKGQSSTSVRKSKQLREVVHYFARKRHMKVLVIGRTHMKKWPAADMTYISRLARTFFTEDISADDPFCLYATVYSGRDCLFVSGDFMRNHKYNLGSRFKDIFERWQKSRQILNFMPGPSGVSVMMPSQFDCGPVRDQGGWHIPYDDGTGNLRSNTQAVLCLRHRAPRRTPIQPRKVNHCD